MYKTYNDEFMRELTMPLHYHVFPVDTDVLIRIQMVVPPADRPRGGGLGSRLANIGPIFEGRKSGHTAIEEADRHTTNRKEEGRIGICFRSVVGVAGISEANPRGYLQAWGTLRSNIQDHHMCQAG